MTVEDQANVTLNPDIAFYHLVFAMITLATTIASLIKSYFFTKVSLRASSVLHNKMFKKVRANR